MLWTTVHKHPEDMLIQHRVLDLCPPCTGLAGKVGDCAFGGVPLVQNDGDTANGWQMGSFSTVQGSYQRQHHLSSDGSDPRSRRA